MIVPLYWAEARLQEKLNGRRVTLRRFGWSNTSIADAQRLADQRLQEALQRLQAGERLDRQEPKVPYNGADGVPIREEIIAVHGTSILTRNSYGALCLNTPNVLFLDLDRRSWPSALGCWMTLALSVVLGALFFTWLNPAVACLLSIIVAVMLVWLLSQLLSVTHQRRLQNWERDQLTRIRDYVDARPDWLVRVYRTPAGLRLLVLHRLFDPQEPEVRDAFEQLQADPQYGRMCLRQNCFRARVSPKPWRIGIADHLRPRPGVWPINPDRLPDRQAWVERYEAQAESYASCEFLEEVGNGSANSAARSVQELHDRLAKALLDLPLA